MGPGDGPLEGPAGLGFEYATVQLPLRNGKGVKAGGRFGELAKIYAAVDEELFKTEVSIFRLQPMLFQSRPPRIMPQPGCTNKLPAPLTLQLVTASQVSVRLRLMCAV